ncbi:hypothetical protein [Paracraurococcus lichenis]|uniref:Gluconate 2-dehydrogenase subunit 3 family protein n=1 Tax=Paracraurococcus lichenis TaxID=3064888 RepID=A0ABT9DWY0_9PROT|nr:hypothetical protein [Paracraurococcus sp. LOR1-02]MDO9708402.1 hypothetical protein [Paracraurococcus sp. LOR1-02]
MRRRDLLAGAAAAPAATLARPAGAAPLGAPAPVSDDPFLRAAFALAGGGEVPDFVLANARRMIETQFGFGSIDALVKAVAAWRPGEPLPRAIEPIAQRLLVILYTGETDGPDPRTRAGHYPWALAWQQLGFAKAPGICGPGFGQWNRT